MSSKIGTFTGKFFDPINPQPEDVCIEDIAHALALTNRFSGHSTVPYSVAEHCVRMSYIVPIELAMDALMHDCAEAYICDMSQPLKQTPEMEGYRDIEDRVEHVCRKALGLPGWTHDPRIKEFDWIMVVTEGRDLGMTWWDSYGITPLPEKIIPWLWVTAEHRFLERYKQLKEIA